MRQNIGKSYNKSLFQKITINVETFKNRNMSELIKKTILAGLGAISLSREKAEEIAGDLIKRGELAKNEEAKFVKDLMDIAEKNKARLEEKIEEVVEKTLTRLDIPTRKEINALREEINRLSKKEKKA